MSAELALLFLVLKIYGAICAIDLVLILVITVIRRKHRKQAEERKQTLRDAIRREKEASAREDSEINDIFFRNVEEVYNDFR